MKLLFFLFSVSTLIPCRIFSQAYPYKFKSLTVDEGLSHTDANDVAQDKQGFIWIATYFGLNRYDGYSIRKFYNSNVPLKNAFKNRVNSIYPDENGNIWLSTEDGLQSFNAKTEKYVDYEVANNGATPYFSKLFKTAENTIYGLTGSRIGIYLIKEKSIEEQKVNLPRDVQFSDMAQDKSGSIYLTSDKGLWLFDKSRNFKKITITGLTDARLSKIYLDNQKNLLISTANKLFLINRKPGLATSATNENFVIGKEYNLPNNSAIKDIIEDNKCDYWINTGVDLLRLDINLQLIQVVDNKSSLYNLNTNSLNKIFIDRSQCLWVCTFGAGVNYCDLNVKLFYTLQHNPAFANSLSSNHVRSVLEDGKNLWIGTNTKGLNLFNLNTKNFTYYNTYNSGIKLKNDAVTSLAFDSDKNLWIGSAAGIDILRPNGKALWRPPGYENFPVYGIETLVKDFFGNMWFGNHRNSCGVIWKDRLNYYHVKYYGEGYFILADKKKPQLFISSTHGLKRVIIDAEGNIKETFHYQGSEEPNSLSSNYTYPVCNENDSTYWIGTIGGGLDKLVLRQNDNSYAVSRYGNSYGVFNDVESLEIDNGGNVWIGGNGLERLVAKTANLTRYDKNDGLQGNSFKVGASWKGADGKLYFGGINGLNFFYPDQIKPNNIEAKPVLTDILINNQRPSYGHLDTSENSLNEVITYSKNLNLNHLQNNFVIFFSSQHFANPLKCQYRYKLFGFDKDWKYTDGESPHAAYSNLDYKSYRFVVEATNNDGVWSTSRAQISIIITPPWWKSGLAKIIYGLLIISGLAGIYVYQANWYRLKREIEVREVNEKKREEIHKQREDFYQQQLILFTNISHEFRTPLTLIVGPLESLIARNKDSLLNNTYQLMLRNAKRLTNLISELMNFKKVADSIIELHVQPLIISSFCEELAVEFQNLAIIKEVSFSMKNDMGNNNQKLTGLFDVQIIEKILLNLLNNAFKYTDAGGQISFEIFFDFEKFKPSYDTEFRVLNESYRAKKYIYFRIADTGIGISKDSISHIFDRYYRVNNSHLGSGVGLALVKSLTQLHKGNIYVYSQRFKGTEIIIGIPWGEENYTEAEKATLINEPASLLEVIDNSILIPSHEVIDDVIDNKKQPITKINKHVLLAEDNEELRTFLRQALEEFYHVYEAEDGNSAMEIATDKVPDLIISDVMMPGINGIELCKLIKDKFETSHIPFIILSAKDALDTKIEGMSSGADFYFGKPLSIDLLLLTVHNIFQHSEKLKLRYTQNYLSDATELVQSEKDKDFLHTILNLIEDNMQDPDLDVDFLCKHLHISRTKLYQKIKSISDQSVGEFIRTIRLKKAIQIMTHEAISMNEVADRIGMQSSSNFSRAFKKEYGKSPMQFIQSLKQN